MREWQKQHHEKLTPEDWFWIGVNGRERSGKNGDTKAPMREEAMDLEQFTDFLNFYHKKMKTKCPKARTWWWHFIPSPPSWYSYHISYKKHG